MVLAGAETTAKGIGGRAIAVELDVTSDDSIRGAVGEVVERISLIEVLVNNAGWDRIEPFLDTQPETWDRVLAINLRGPIAVTRAVLDSMIERRIVSIASDAARAGSPVPSSVRSPASGSTSTPFVPGRPTRRCSKPRRRRTPS
jgi:2-hydroxycyclohexanecarboxyl-CoA dehydrogenase